MNMWQNKHIYIDDLNALVSKVRAKKPTPRDLQACINQFDLCIQVNHPIQVYHRIFENLIRLFYVAGSHNYLPHEGLYRCYKNLLDWKGNRENREERIYYLIKTVVQISEEMNELINEKVMLIVLSLVKKVGSEALHIFVDYYLQRVQNYVKSTQINKNKMKQHFLVLSKLSAKLWKFKQQVMKAVANYLPSDSSSAYVSVFMLLEFEHFSSTFIQLIKDKQLSQNLHYPEAILDNQGTCKYLHSKFIDILVYLLSPKNMQNIQVLHTLYPQNTKLRNTSQLFDRMLYNFFTRKQVFQSMNNPRSTGQRNYHTIHEQFQIKAIIRHFYIDKIKSEKHSNNIHDEISQIMELCKETLKVLLIIYHVHRIRDHSTCISNHKLMPISIMICYTAQLVEFKSNRSIRFPILVQGMIKIYLQLLAMVDSQFSRSIISSQVTDEINTLKQRSSTQFQFESCYEQWDKTVQCDRRDNFNIYEANHESSTQTERLIAESLSFEDKVMAYFYGFFQENNPGTLMLDDNRTEIFINCAKKIFVSPHKCLQPWKIILSVIFEIIEEELKLREGKIQRSEKNDRIGEVAEKALNFFGIKPQSQNKVQRVDNFQFFIETPLFQEFSRVLTEELVAHVPLDELVPQIKKIISRHYDKVSENVIRVHADNLFFLQCLLLTGNLNKCRVICEILLKKSEHWGEGARLQQFCKLFPMGHRQQSILIDYITFLATRDRIRFRMHLYQKQCQDCEYLLEYGLHNFVTKPVHC